MVATTDKDKSKPSEISNKTSNNSVSHLTKHANELITFFNYKLHTHLHAHTHIQKRTVAIEAIEYVAI